MRLFGDDVPIPMFPEFLSTQSRGEEDPTERKGDVTGFVNILGVDDPIKKDPAMEEVAIVDVPVKFGRLKAVYMVEVESFVKFATPCIERIDPGVDVPPSPILLVELFHTRLSVFERAEDDVK